MGDLLKKIDGIMVFITAVGLLSLTIFTVVDVAGRFLFNTPIPASTSIANLIMPYIGFGSLSYALYRGEHVRITIMIEKFPKYTKYFNLLTHLIGTLFSAVLTYGAWRFFWKSFAIKEMMLAVILLPWYVGKFAIFAGYFVFTLRFIYSFWKELNHKR